MLTLINIFKTLINIFNTKTIRGIIEINFHTLMKDKFSFISTPYGKYLYVHLFTNKKHKPTIIFGRVTFIT